MNTNQNEVWVIRKKWPKRALWLLGTLALICAIAYPLYADYSDNIRVIKIMSATDAAREKVEAVLLGGSSGKVMLDAVSLIPESLNEESKNGEKIELSYRDIDAHGQIKIFTPQLGVLIVLSPTVSDKKVIWSCWGRPLKVVPQYCKDSRQS